MKLLFKIGRFFALFHLLVSCSESDQKQNQTATSGQVTIEVDPSFKPIFDALDYTFESFYPTANINIQYLHQGDLLSQLSNDSCKAIVMGRDLSLKEKESFARQNLFPVSTKIAEDAIAIITNKNSHLNSLTVLELKNILKGKYTEEMKVVFENSKSANAIYAKDSLLFTQNFSENVFAFDSIAEVINYLINTPNSIGFLGVNWLSDRDDKKVINRLKEIKLIAIAKDSLSKAYLPYQAHIKTKEYPLTREVFMISRQKQGSLGMGFVTFVAGERGQLMMLKAGLVPAFPPERIIKTTK